METEIKTSLPTKLVSLRKQKGLTQMDLAERLNVSRQAVSRWEVGAAVPSTDNLKILGELYGVQIDYLLHGELGDDIGSLQKLEEHPMGQAAVGKRNKYMVVVCCVLVFLIATAVLIWMAQSKVNGVDQAIPIEDMVTDQEDNYALVTFPFEE